MTVGNFYCLKALTELSIKALSIYGDGTSIKNQQHEARSITFPAHTTNQDPHTSSNSLQNSPPVLRSLGVGKSANHTAQSQLAGWISAIDSCCKLLKASPLGQDISSSTHGFASKLRGMVSDHASDQKRLCDITTEWKRNCDREMRGAYALQQMSTEEQLQALSTHLEHACAHSESWDQLLLDQQSVLVHDAWLALALQLGQDDFQKLSNDQQYDIDVVVWTGCCMHKEMNSVKGGATAMAGAWSKLGLKPPIPLRNKYEVKDTSISGDEKVSRGAVKLTSLAGAIINHKDDKKGAHQVINNYFEVRFLFYIC